MGIERKVELADLRGWSDQVERAGGDCTDLADLRRQQHPDGTSADSR